MARLEQIRMFRRLQRRSSWSNKIMNSIAQDTDTDGKIGHSDTNEAKSCYHGL